MGEECRGDMLHAAVAGRRFSRPPPRPRLAAPTEEGLWGGHRIQLLRILGATDLLHSLGPEFD